MRSRKTTGRKVPKDSIPSERITNSSLVKLGDDLKNIYWTEEILTKTIPMMIRNTTSKELVQTLELHLLQTREIIKRTERCLKYLIIKQRLDN